MDDAIPHSVSMTPASNSTPHSIFRIPHSAFRTPRSAGPLRLAFTRAIQDWYYGLIPFSIMNFFWIVLVLTVVGGPPATAAMLGVARDAATGQGGEPRQFFFYLRQYFWRAWGLGLVTFLVSVILLTDLGFYTDLMSENLLLLNIGSIFMLYVLIVWLEFLLIAWPLLVNQPEMPLRHVMRNAAILTLRMPGANFGLALVVIFLCVVSLSFGIILALALAAIVSLMAQHYLHMQAPVLANFPPPPGAGAVPPDEEL
ncbi:MAG TPA: DUF624 domain-containing protein [Chloroflexia bacterium]